MKITLSVLALSIATAASSPVAGKHSNRGYLPTSQVRSIGMKALHKARSKVLSDRKLQDDVDLSNLDLENIDLENIDMDAIMSGLVPLMCDMLDLDLGQDILGEEDMGSDGLICTEMGCDDADPPNLVMKCHMDEGEICEVYEGEDYCVTNVTMETSMELNFDTSRITTEQCAHYTSPPEMEALKGGCMNIEVTMNYGEMMSLEWDMTDDEIDALDVNDFIEIIQCSAEFGDDSTCACGFCNDGRGFNLTCNNGLGMDECANFDGPTDVGATVQGGSESEEATISILRLVELPGADNVISDAPDPNDTDSDNTEPDNVEPDTTEPDNVEPDTADNVEPDTTEPAKVEPDTTEPAKVEPDTTEPAEVESDMTDADINAQNDPDDTSPAASRSGAAAAGFALALTSLAALM